MKRPTIADLAAAADVSISTVNRIIGGSSAVRQPTRERVLAAAAEIGFYGLGSIEHHVKSKRDVYRLGVLLQQGGRTFYRTLGESISRAAKQFPGAKVELNLEYLDDLSPRNIAARIKVLSQNCDAVALVSSEHPLVSDAIDAILEKNIPVVGLIAPLSARGNVSYVGLNHWKVGRTAAWAFDKMAKRPGTIATFLGSHRYRNQELNESGFRSYFREHDNPFTLLEPQSTHESMAVGQELTNDLIAQHPDLVGIFVSGGGVSGVINSLREHKKQNELVVVGYELFDLTRDALLDGTMTMVISHPMEKMAYETIATLIRAKKAGTESGAQNVTLDFDIYTSENVGG